MPEDACARKNGVECEEKWPEIQLCAKRSCQGRLEEEGSKRWIEGGVEDGGV